MDARQNNEGDRAAATVTKIPVLDGLFGDYLEVEATSEGLEFGGYSVLPWEWIDFARQTIRLSAEQSSSPDSESHTETDESGVAP